MEELHLEDLGKYDPTRVDTEIRVASSILIYTLHTGRTYNMWRFQGAYRYDMMMHLHALVTVISMELFIAAIESFGVGVNDSPGYREYMESVAFDDLGVGSISLTDTIYDMYDVMYVDITHTIYALHRCENDLQVFIMFLKACKHYTFIDGVVARMYDVIEKHRHILLSKVSRVEYNKYLDVLPVLDYEDIGDLPNDIILEYISTEMKNNDIFPFTYYEYLGKKDSTPKSAEIQSHKKVANVIQKIMSNSEIDESVINRMLDGESYESITNEIEYNKRKEVTGGRL